MRIRERFWIWAAEMAYWFATHARGRAYTIEYRRRSKGKVTPYTIGDVSKACKEAIPETMEQVNKSGEATLRIFGVQPSNKPYNGEWHGQGKQAQTWQ